ncbi:hypothetical protein JOC45_003604 [Gordonia hydrophobica]|nr:hypothetical protein [Gordonia hydrophobica]
MSLRWETAGTLYAYNVGTEVAENHRRMGTGSHPSEFENSDTRKRAYSWRHLA